MTGHVHAVSHVGGVHSTARLVCLWSEGTRNNKSHHFQRVLSHRPASEEKEKEEKEEEEEEEEAVTS